MESRIDIPYGLHDLNKLDLYTPPNSEQKPLIVFVHGGAWRAGDKAQHAQLATRLALRTDCAVALPNYRLTPGEPTPETALHHPAHAEDVLAALEFLLTPPIQYNPRALFVIGHSCGAHILTSIFLDTSSSTPSLSPSTSLLASIKALVIAEGIYDIDRLLLTFPSYIDFIGNAFVVRKSYKDVSPVTFTLRSGAEHITWLTIHSSGDELVDEVQSRVIYDHLGVIYGKEAGIKIRKDFTTMEEGHDAVLTTDKFAELVANLLWH